MIFHSINSLFASQSILNSGKFIGWKYQQQQVMLGTKKLCPYMLLQLLSMPRTLSTSILLRMSVEAARGLYFVHCCDVVHGNVSSSKYLVDEDLHVKVFCPRSMRYCTEVSDIWEPAFLCCFTSGNNALRSSEAWRQKRLIANKPRDQLL